MARGLGRRTLGNWAAAPATASGADPTRSFCLLSSVMSSAVSTGALSPRRLTPRCASRKRSLEMRHVSSNVRSVHRRPLLDAQSGIKPSAARRARTQRHEDEPAQPGSIRRTSDSVTIDHNAHVHVPLKPQRDTETVSHTAKRNQTTRLCRSPGHIHVPSCNPPSQQTYAACERGCA